MRDSKVNDIICELREYGIEPVVADAVADPADAKKAYGVDLVGLDDIKDIDAVIMAVSHDEYAGLPMETIDGFFGEGQKVLLDIKEMLNRNEYESVGYNYWRL